LSTLSDCPVGLSTVGSSTVGLSTVGLSGSQLRSWGIWFGLKILFETYLIPYNSFFYLINIHLLVKIESKIEFFNKNLSKFNLYIEKLSFFNPARSRHKSGSGAEPELGFEKVEPGAGAGVKGRSPEPEPELKIARVQHCPSPVAFFHCGGGHYINNNQKSDLCLCTSIRFKIWNLLYNRFLRFWYLYMAFSICRDQKKFTYPLTWWDDYAGNVHKHALCHCPNQGAKPANEMGILFQHVSLNMAILLT
jgi:hypothetical protein